jgi:hypothetical protein
MSDKTIRETSATLESTKVTAGNGSVHVAKPNRSSKKNRKKDKDIQRARFPRHTLEKVLRIPKAILEQHAGKECTEREAANFVGAAYGGGFQLELSSAIKYGLLERPGPRRVQVSELAKTILRPQRPEQELEGKREAVLKAPEISDVYKHYRGENLPDKQFFDNALVDTFRLPQDKLNEFYEVFYPTLESAKLLEKVGDKFRVIDITRDATTIQQNGTALLHKLGKDVKIAEGDSCFVMMPFAAPHGSYYQTIYEPAIRKAGLKPIRADSEIFGTGKIIDQISSGIRAAKVLVAELTTRNPNVFYELGLAHGLQKPVVLVSSNENDVPFDLKHIRVIYYDVTDPFWGSKLLDKVAENILSAIKNPNEAVFARAVELAST